MSGCPVLDGRVVFSGLLQDVLTIDVNYGVVNGTKLLPTINTYPDVRKHWCYRDGVRVTTQISPMTVQDGR